jgi:hypothetical protein
MTTAGAPTVQDDHADVVAESGRVSSDDART